MTEAPKPVVPKPSQVSEMVALFHKEALKPVKTKRVEMFSTVGERLSLESVVHLKSIK